MQVFSSLGRFYRPLVVLGWLFSGGAAFAQQGALIIAGGGVGEQDIAIWQAIAKEARVNGEILVISAGSGEPEAAGAEAVALLQRSGIKATVVPLSVIPGSFAGQGARAAADLAWAQRARAAGGFFFTGGAQGRIRDALAPDDRDSPLLIAIRAAQAEGAVIAGTSAGAAIMSSTMFRDPGGQLQMLSSGPQGQDMGKGLGFLGRSWLVDQHFLARDRFLRLAAGLCALGAGAIGGLGIDEGTALLVRGDRAEIIGRSGVIVMRWEGAKSCAPLEGRAQIALAHPGDAISLLDGRVEAAGPRRTLRSQLRPGAVGAVPASNSLSAALQKLAPDISEDSLFVAMEVLESGRAADLGWRVRVRAGEGATGWPAGDRLSVAGAELEFTPFRIEAPPALAAQTP